MSSVTVRFYGRFAEEVAPETTIAIPPGGLAVHELRSRLAAQFAAPQLQGPRVRAAVDDAIVTDDFVVGEGATVDLLAPVSGG